MASPSAVAAPAPKKRINLAQFFREVRAEARRITWTSRRETWITSVMVAIMVALAALFFSAVDALWGWLIPTILKLATGG
jgi:preprotein translocase subunit SecE